MKGVVAKIEQCYCCHPCSCCCCCPCSCHYLCCCCASHMPSCASLRRLKGLLLTVCCIPPPSCSMSYASVIQYNHLWCFSKNTTNFKTYEGSRIIRPILLSDVSRGDRFCDSIGVDAFLCETECQTFNLQNTFVFWILLAQPDSTPVVRVEEVEVGTR